MYYWEKAWNPIVGKSRFCSRNERLFNFPSTRQISAQFFRDEEQRDLFFPNTSATKERSIQQTLTRKKSGSQLPLHFDKYFLFRNNEFNLYQPVVPDLKRRALVDKQQLGLKNIFFHSSVCVTNPHPNLAPRLIRTQLYTSTTKHACRCRIQGEVFYENFQIFYLNLRELRGWISDAREFRENSQPSEALYQGK